MSGSVRTMRWRQFDSGTDRIVPWVTPLVLLPSLLSDPYAFTRYQSLRFATLSVAVGGAAVVLVWKGWRLPRSLVLAAAGLLLAASVSALASDSLTFGLWGAPARCAGAVSLLLMMAAGYVGTAVGGKPEARLATPRWIALTGLGLGTLTLLQWAGVEVLGVPEIGASGRWTGPSGSAAQLGAFALLLGPPSLGLWIDDDAPDRDRYLGMVSTVLLSLALVASGARAAWVGGVIAALVVLWSTRGKGLWRKRSRHTLSGASVALVVCVLALGTQRSRLGGLFGGDQTIRGRWDIWRTAVPAIGDRWFLGWGLDQGRNGLVAYLPAGFEARYGDAEIIDRAHSVLLDVLLAGGVVGLIMTAVLIIVWVQQVRKVALSIHEWMLIAALAGFAGHLAFNFPFPEIDAIAWFVAGVVIGRAGWRQSWRRGVAWAVRGLAAFVAVGFGVLATVHWAADHRLDHAARLEARGELASAASHYRSAGALAPFSPVFREALARYLLRTGDMSAAVLASDDALSQAPDDLYLKELALQSRVQSAFLSGDSSLATSLVVGYRGLTIKAPQHVSFRTGLSLALLLAGDIEGARATAAQASAELPQSDAPEVALSLIESVAGNEEAALIHALEAERRAAAQP